MVKINKYREIQKNGPKFIKALFDRNTPLAPKLFVLAAILYAIMPADIINDFLPVLGYADDIVMLPLLIYMANKSLEKYQIEESVIDGEVIEGEIIG